MSPAETHATTVGALRASGYRPRGVREEMRANLLAALGRDGDASRLFPGLVGYADSVIPEVENAVLAGHHMVLLGERGQAKTRLVRGLAALLDDAVPAVDGCEIHCDPLGPVCATCRRRTREEGDGLGVAWIGREARYVEKLATPDVTIADLFGEVDPARLAEGRRLGDEEVLHFGLAARSHRGIFAINELPDLAEKVQVGLFNLMEERDLQIRGFQVRLALDVVVVATANPQDYTSRGRIVTPLKDRFDVQVRTHYPRSVEEEVGILALEVPLDAREGRAVRVPAFLSEAIARFTMEARRAPEVDQSAGVSVRVSINNLETVIANAEKRAVLHGEEEIVPRPSDLHSVYASTNGKLELDFGVDGAREGAVIDRLLDVALAKAFDARLREAGIDEGTSASTFEEVASDLRDGRTVEASDRTSSREYETILASMPSLGRAVRLLEPSSNPALRAAAMELVLEGLHLAKKLGRRREGGRLAWSG